MCTVGEDVRTLLETGDSEFFATLAKIDRLFELLGIGSYQDDRAA